MFGMIILNSKKMFGDNICAKLRVFDKRIEEFTSIKFNLYDPHDELLQEASTFNKGDDEQSSPFIDFGDLMENIRYKIVAQCYKDKKIEYETFCYASTSVFGKSKDDFYLSTFAYEDLPMTLDFFGDDNSSEMPFIFEKTCEE